MTSDAPHSRPDSTPSSGHHRDLRRSRSRGASPDGGRPAPAQPVVIDCDSCSMRGLGCGDCMVTVMLGGPPFGVVLDDDERRALDVLVDAGLIPPLRMVTAHDSIHVVDT